MLLNWQGNEMITWFGKEVFVAFGIESRLVWWNIQVPTTNNESISFFHICHIPFGQGLLHSFVWRIHRWWDAQKHMYRLGSASSVASQHDWMHPDLLGKWILPRLFIIKYWYAINISFIINLLKPARFPVAAAAIVDTLNNRNAS